jgi:hypothetical protein
MGDTVLQGLFGPRAISGNSNPLGGACRLICLIYIRMIARSDATFSFRGTQLAVTLASNGSRFRLDRPFPYYWANKRRSQVENTAEREFRGKALSLRFEGRPADAARQTQLFAASCPRMWQKWRAVENGRFESVSARVSTLLQFSIGPAYIGAGA